MLAVSPVQSDWFTFNKTTLSNLGSSQHASFDFTWLSTTYHYMSCWTMGYGSISVVYTWYHASWP